MHAQVLAVADKADMHKCIDHLSSRGACVKFGGPCCEIPDQADWYKKGTCAMRKCQRQYCYYNYQPLSVLLCGPSLLCAVTDKCPVTCAFTKSLAVAKVRIEPTPDSKLTIFHSACGVLHHQAALNHDHGCHGNQVTFCCLNKLWAKAIETKDGAQLTVQ